MKVVAVTQRVDELSEHNERRDALDQRLNTFLLAAGFSPVPVPNQLYNASPNGLCNSEALDIWLDAIKPLAFVLSGGNDIGQCTERDNTERALLTHAQQSQLPVLGICRGMQMMANWAGANLHVVQGHIRTKHYLTGKIIGEVNSYHGFALVSCPADFDVIARSEDGEIEAISHNSLPWEGWMWHPEREEKFADRDLERVKALFGV